MRKAKKKNKKWESERKMICSFCLASHSYCSRFLSHIQKSEFVKQKEEEKMSNHLAQSGENCAIHLMWLNVLFFLVLFLEVSIGKEFLFKQFGVSLTAF